MFAVISLAKNYRPFSLLSVVSKIFKKLFTNRLFDHLERCGLFVIISYGLSVLAKIPDFGRLFQIGKIWKRLQEGLRIFTEGRKCNSNCKPSGKY